MTTAIYGTYMKEQLA